MDQTYYGLALCRVNLDYQSAATRDWKSAKSEEAATTALKEARVIPASIAVSSSCIPPLTVPLSVMVEPEKVPRLTESLATPDSVARLST